MSRLGSLAATTVTLALAISAFSAEAAQAVSLGPADTTPPVTTRVATPTAGHHLMIDRASAPPLTWVKAWQAASSPYRAINAYIRVDSSYDNRHDKDQTELDPTWVSQVLAGGWQILPTYVGLQSPCPTTPNTGKFRQMSMDAATARSQGVSAAVDAAQSVRDLRMPATAPIAYDLEGYTSGNAGCSAAVQAFLAGWTTRLHQLGLRSGVYGSRSSTMTDVTNASMNASYPRPDMIWLATWNGVANTTFSTPPAGMWEGNRINQFTHDVTRSYGGYPMTVDENAVQNSLWDRTAPRLVAAQPPRATKRGRVRIGWRSVDASGVARYQVRIKHNRGPWKSPKDLRRTKRSAQAFTLKPGERWCVSARATDRVGNTSAWSAPRCTARFTDDRALTAGRGWTRVRGGYLNTGTKTFRKGAVLRGNRVSGTQVGVILHGRGTVAVLIGGRVVGQVRGNGTKWITLPAHRSGRIAFRTLTRGKVIVDGYAVTD